MNHQKITREQIQEAVYSWGIRFPEAGYDPDQLEILALEYYEDLVDDITPSRIGKVFKLVRKRCKYFPKVADILDIYSEVSKEYNTGDLFLPENTESTYNPTPEEIRKNKRRTEILADCVAGVITHEEATKMLEAMSD